MTAIEAIATRAPAGDRRGLLPGAPGDRRRAAGRHDRRRRRVQLLSDEESRRARRRRRGRHQRSRARRPGEAAAKRRPDRPLPSPGAGHQFAAGRNAGGDPARAAAASLRLDRPAARAGGALSRGSWPAARSIVPPRARRRARLPSLRRPAPRGARRDLQAHLAARGIETLDALSRADPAAAGARRVRSGRTARSPRRVCDEVLSLPLHPAARRRVDDVARRCTPSAAVGDLCDERTRRVRALITGGAGFIGSHLAEALLDHGRRGADSRQSVDRLDRQHRPPQGAARLRVLHRLGEQRAAARRARSIAATSCSISPPPSASS